MRGWRSGRFGIHGLGRFEFGPFSKAECHSGADYE